MCFISEAPATGLPQDAGAQARGGGARRPRPKLLYIYIYYMQFFLYTILYYILYSKNNKNK